MPMDRKLETLASGLSYTECPRWHEGRLWISDFYTHRVMAIDDSGNIEKLADVPNQPSGIGFLPDGDALIVSMRDRRILRRGKDGALTEYADLSSLAPWHVNDMTVDKQGRAWVGNFGFDLMSGAPIAATGLIRVDPDGSAQVVADDLLFPNGMVMTDDGKTLIVAETFGQRLTAFDISQSGELVNRRVWAQIGDIPTTTDVHEFIGQSGFVPDGMCMDAEGAIWVADAMGKRALRIAEGGEVLDEVSGGDMGIYACMLGGKDGKTLYLCCAPTFAEDALVGAASAKVQYARVDVPHAGMP